MTELKWGCVSLLYEPGLWVSKARGDSCWYIIERSGNESRFIHSPSGYTETLTSLFEAQTRAEELEDGFRICSLHGLAGCRACELNHE